VDLEIVKQFELALEISKLIFTMERDYNVSCSLGEMGKLIYGNH
jgi:hypothetical protein